MDAQGAVKKIMLLKTFVLMVVVGLVFAVVGCIVATIPQADMLSATATVTDIQSSYDAAREETDYQTTIIYTDAEGNSHSAVIGYYYTGLTVGSTFEIEYDPLNPENISTPGGEFIPYVFIVIGVGLFAFGLYKSIIALKTPSDKMNNFNQVDMSAAPFGNVAETQYFDEPTGEYYFHFTKSIKQGYILETLQQKPVFEAVALNLALITKYKYNFINHLTRKETVREVTHTVSTSVGGNHVQCVTDSHFKIDGVNCWQALGKMGYSLTPHLSGLNISFDVNRWGTKVGSFEMAGTNVVTGKDYKLGNIPTMGIFKVSCRESDIEGFFLACFIVSRTYH